MGCAVGCVPPPKRSNFSDAAPVETTSMLFAISAGCVLAAILARPIYSLISAAR
jgi:hypothetical protein